MYIATVQGQTTPGHEILMSTETSCHFAHLLQKIYLKSEFIQFFSWFSILPRDRAWQPVWDEILMSTGTSCPFSHLLQVLNKFLWSPILSNFLYDLIHVYSPEAGADSPQGTKFWYQQKGLITLPICCKFQRNLFECWFYTNFFMI